MIGVQRDRRRAEDRQLLLWAVALGMLYFAREVFIPIALAALLAFLLAPVATRLERMGMRRVLAVVLVIATAFSAVAALGWVVMGQVYSLAVELPQYQPNVTTKIESLHLHSAGKLTSTMQMLSDISHEISGAGDDAPASGTLAPPTPAARETGRRGKRQSAAEMAAENAAAAAAAAQPQKKAEPIAVRVEEPDTPMLTVAGRSVRPLIHPLTTATIVLVFVVFMLLGRDDLRDRAIRLAGSSRMHVTTVAMTDASARVSRYLLMQFVVNVSYGAVVALALWRIGVPHPLLWAVMTALLRFVPYAGILMAAAGPILMAAAVSPHWAPVLWTMGVYLVLELVAANFLEPMLYGSSTGVSAFAIMIAAIFWTWMWGIPGLLLSTPLTVCLIVIGRHVPRLEFLGVMFGEESVLEPQQRFYQRILALEARDATRVLEDMLKTEPREQVYDTVVVPALALVEDARHAEEIDGTRAEQVLQGMEDAVEESWSRTPSVLGGGRPKQRLICVAARDFADEIACRLLEQLMSDRYRVQVLAADMLTADVLEALRSGEPDVVCVVGVPPQTVRHVRLRCHQVRSRFPEMVVAACVLSAECDLSSIRGRIPMEDAQHVVCSLANAKEYLTAMSDPVAAVVERVAATAVEGVGHDAPSMEELRRVDLLDGPDDGVFERIAVSLAKAFDAPIALVNAKDGGRTFWRAQCGLADDAAGEGTTRDLSICSQTMEERTEVVPDVAEDERFAADPFLLANGIRFYAAAALRTQEGEQIGCLCVMDTRPRQVTEQQREILQSLADQVTNAIELQMTAELVTGRAEVGAGS